MAPFPYTLPYLSVEQIQFDGLSAGAAEEIPKSLVVYLQHLDPYGVVNLQEGGGLASIILEKATCSSLSSTPPQ